MFEPLAATLLNSILPSRPLAAQFFASKTSLGMAVRTAKPSLPPDFFTPHSWSAQVKGKGKALPEDEHVACGGIFNEGCLMSNETLVQGAAAASMTNLNSPRPRTRSASAHKHIASACASHFPSLRIWMRQVDVVQRRHASSRSTVEPVSNPPGQDERRALLRTFERVADGAETFSAEDAWRAFRYLCDSQAHAPEPPSAALNFVSNITMSIAHGRQGTLSPELLHLWGTRIQDMLHHIDPGIQGSEQDPVRVLWNNLSICASAMMGKLDETLVSARTLLHNTQPDRKDIQQAHALQVYLVLVLALRQHRGPFAVLNFLAQEWDILHIFLVEHPIIYMTDGQLANAAVLFSSTALGSVSDVQDLDNYLQERLPVLSHEQQSAVGFLLVRVLVQARRSKEALAIVQLLQRQAVVLPDEASLVLSRSLAKAKLYDDANALFFTIPAPPVTSKRSVFRAYHLTGLYLSSRLGDVERAQHHYDLLERYGRASLSDKASLMHAYATLGDPLRVVDLFNRFFPASSYKNTPNIVHYTTVLYAYAQVGDLDALDTWLRKLSNAGLRPDLYIYSIVLQSFALRSDVQSMYTLIDQMRKSGINMTRVLYTTIIATLARRGDPMAAERLFKRAVGEGIQPDLQMVSAIMNAHVESGSWQGVIRAFDYLNTPGRPGAGLNIEVFNTLMKAYVFIGAPFRVVANLFRQLDRVKLRPDSRTFILLIQSACDSGFMDIAEDLFVEMERLSTDNNHASLKVDIYVLTVILSGYLRRGKRIKAKEVLEDIKARGFQTNAIAYAAILRAYSQQKSDQGTAVAESFLQSLTAPGDVDSWLQMIGGRKLALETVFRPVMNAYVRLQQPEDVARLHEDMAKAGGQPSLGTVTMLLDAYRRTRNIAAVQSIWPDVYRLGREFAQENALLSLDDHPLNFGMYGPLFCVPLSIYIDALSAAGKHAEVAQTWKKLKDEGLQFDSHNWNHLVTALVRAGEPQRAFDIVENVILRYQAQSRREFNRERDMHPTSPLTLDLPPPEEGDLPPHRPEAPLHIHQRRRFAAERATRRLRHNTSLEERGSADFAHPLHLMFKMSPLWNTWRPHGATLVLLGQVLHHLGSGRLVQAIDPAVDQDFAQEAMTMEELRKRTNAAGLVLNEIHDRFPQAVQLVKEYELMRRARRNASSFEYRS